MTTTGGAESPVAWELGQGHHQSLYFKPLSEDHPITLGGDSFYFRVGRSVFSKVVEKNEAEAQDGG